MAAAASGGTLPVVQYTPAEQRCAAEITALRGVWRGDWRSPQTFTPAYADLQLVIYLSGLAGPEAGLAVVPIYAVEPLIFRSARIVFVSTGLVLQATSEQQLIHAIRDAPLQITSGALPHCGVMPLPAARDLEAVQRKLAAQLAQYQDLGVRTLRRRDASRH